jgi:hypothetical protein
VREREGGWAARGAAATDRTGGGGDRATGLEREGGGGPRLGGKRREEARPKLLLGLKSIIVKRKINFN